MCLKNKSLTDIFFKMRATIWIVAMLFLVGMIIFGLTSCESKKPDVFIGLSNPINDEPQINPNPFPTPTKYCFANDSLEMECLPPIIEPHPRSAEEIQREWEDEDIEREDDHYYGEKGTPAREARREQRENGCRDRIG